MYVYMNNQLISFQNYLAFYISFAWQRVIRLISSPNSSSDTYQCHVARELRVEFLWAKPSHLLKRLTLVVKKRFKFSYALAIIFMHKKAQIMQNKSLTQ